MKTNSILLDGIPQIEDHRVDLSLEGVHFSASLDRDEPSKVTIGGCGTNLGEASHLRGKITGHGVHRETVRTVRQISTNPNQER